jgi:hypothetical protein
MSLFRNLIHPYLTARKRLLLASLTATLSLSVYADYIADMVVFEHRTTDAWLEEYWPLLPLKLDTKAGDIDLSPNISGFGWKWLNSGSATMRTLEQRLNSVGSYHTIAKASWIQPAQNRESGKTAVLQTTHPDNATPIQVRVLIHKQKFEHIQIEAQIEKTIPTGVREVFAIKNKQELSHLPETWRFTLSESRKLKTGEVNYFDHPQFGVLILLTSTEAS